MTDTFSSEDTPSEVGTALVGGRLRRNLVAAGAGIVVVALAAMLLIPRPAAEDEHDAIFHRFTGEKRERVISKEQDWHQSAGFVEAPTVPERLESAIGLIRGAVDDPDHLLSEGALKSLMATIKEHALARSERSPERYLALCDAESELYEWVPVNNPAITSFMGYWGLDAGPEGTVESALRNVWRLFYDEKGDRFDAIGVPPMGTRIVVRKARTKVQGEELFFGYDEDDLIQHWTGELMTTGAQQFRTPRRAIEAVLQNQPSVTVVQIMILVRMANGIPINWISSWFQDPDTGGWVCSWTVYKRARLTSLIF